MVGSSGRVGLIGAEVGVAVAAALEANEPAGGGGQIQVGLVLDEEQTARREDGGAVQLFEEFEREGARVAGGVVWRVEVDDVEAALLLLKLGDEDLGFGAVQFHLAQFPLPQKTADPVAAPTVRFVEGDAGSAAEGLQADLAGTGTQVEKGAVAQIGAEHGEERFLEPGGGEADVAEGAVGGDHPPAEKTGDDAQGSRPFQERSGGVKSGCFVLAPR